jgi:ribosomal protein S2
VSSASPARVVVTRRRALAVLGLAGLAVPVLAGCTTSTASEGPDPLIPLADRARADVALVTAAIGADPALTDRLDPLRSARTDHATALQAEIDRLAGAETPA